MKKQLLKNIRNPKKYKRRKERAKDMDHSHRGKYKNVYMYILYILCIFICIYTISMCKMYIFTHICIYI